MFLMFVEKKPLNLLLLDTTFFLPTEGVWVKFMCWDISIVRRPKREGGGLGPDPIPPHTPLY